MHDLSELEVGKAAEHLVVADLILLGRRAYLSDQGLPYDVVVDIDGRLIRLQVKATRKPKPIPQRAVREAAYMFHTRRGGKGGQRRYSAIHFDMLALVALDIRQIAYMAFTSDIPGCINLRTVGSQPRKNATRLKNIDGFPFEEATRAVLAKS
jgi:hypothetical protein